MVEAQLEVNQVERELITLAGREPLLALTKLRIELEHAVNQLILDSTRARQVPGVLTGARALKEAGLIDQWLASSIEEVYRLTLRAIHSGEVTPAEAARIIDLGIILLKNLSMLKPISDR
jgi:hypothetical protein